MTRYQVNLSVSGGPPNSQRQYIVTAADPYTAVLIAVRAADADGMGGYLESVLGVSELAS